MRWSAERLVTSSSRQALQAGRQAGRKNEWLAGQHPAGSYRQRSGWAVGSKQEAGGRQWAASRQHTANSTQHTVVGQARVASSYVHSHIATALTQHTARPEHRREKSDRQPEPVAKQATTSYRRQWTTHATGSPAGSHRSPPRQCMVCLRSRQ